MAVSCWACQPHFHSVAATCETLFGLQSDVWSLAEVQELGAFFARISDYMFLSHALYITRNNGMNHLLRGEEDLYIDKLGVP